MPGDNAFLSPSVLAWLRCFDAAARCGSFTKAAQLLHVSQGAVSQQVKKLEDRVGHALLLRTPEGLRQTREGERLSAATRDAFSALEKAMHRLDAARVQEPLNLSCSPSFAMFWLTLRLGGFYREHPHLALRVVGESDRIDSARMSRENIAAAVRFDRISSSDPTGVDLFDEWLVPVATPAFMQAHPNLQHPSGLQGTHMVHAADPFEGTEPTEEWAHWLDAAQVELPQAALRQGTQFTHSFLAIQAALGSQGIAMGRAALVLGYLLQGRLIVPFPMRVQLEASYRFIGNASYPEMPTVLAWFQEEAVQYMHQRDAQFARQQIVAAGQK